MQIVAMTGLSYPTVRVVFDWYETGGWSAIRPALSSAPERKRLKSTGVMRPPWLTPINIRVALISMPHKVTTVDLLDEVPPTAEIAGACNVVRHLAVGRLQGDMLDGEGFVRRINGRTLLGDANWRIQEGLLQADFLSSKVPNYRLTVKLNGATTADVADKAHTKGHIALKYGSGIVKFRDVIIRLP